MARRTTVAKKKARRNKAKTPKRPGPVIRVPEHTVEIVSAPVADPLVAGADQVDRLAAWLLQQADLSGV